MLLGVIYTDALPTHPAFLSPTYSPTVWSSSLSYIIFSNSIARGFSMIYPFIYLFIKNVLEAF